MVIKVRIKKVSDDRYVVTVPGFTGVGIGTTREEAIKAFLVTVHSALAVKLIHSDGEGEFEFNLCKPTP